MSVAQKNEYFDKFDNFGRVELEDPEYWQDYEKFENLNIGFTLSQSNILRRNMHERIYWLDFCYASFKPYNQSPTMNKFGQELCDLRKYFKSYSSSKYIGMLQDMKKYIDMIIYEEKKAIHEYNKDKIQLKNINLTLIYCIGKLSILAKKARQNVENEYAPKCKRGLRCIHEFMLDFHS
mgnify:CR=1 FL=1